MHAITRPPTAALARCALTYLERRPIDVDAALRQHAAYVAALAAWMAGDLAETGSRARRAADLSRAAGRPAPPAVASIQGSLALFEGRLDDVEPAARAARLLRRRDPDCRRAADRSGAVGAAGDR